jgi:putative oxidoreductase
MIKKLFDTKNDLSGTVLRLLLGIVIFPHGAQKLLGWFGGAGFGAAMEMFTTRLHIPSIFAFLPILVESVGAVALLTGFGTRIASLGIAIDMIVAVILVHLKNGFFMNWAGSQKGEGFEYHLLVVAIALALMMRGAGRWSIDGVIAKKLKT